MTSMSSLQRIITGFQLPKRKVKKYTIVNISELGRTVEQMIEQTFFFPLKWGGGVHCVGANVFIRVLLLDTPGIMSR